MIGSVNRRDQRRFFRRGVSFLRGRRRRYPQNAAAWTRARTERAVDRKNNDTTRETVGNRSTDSRRAGRQAGAA